jgi:hypothetical protein
MVGYSSALVLASSADAMSGKEERAEEEAK